QVLVLDAPDRPTGLLAGLTSNYVEVLFPGPEGLGRRMATVEITEVRGDRTYGRLGGAGAGAPAARPRPPSPLSASSAAAASTRWRASRICAGSGYGRPSASHPTRSADPESGV